MKLLIPNDNLITTYDAMIKIAREFPVDMQQLQEAVELEGSKEDLLDFLTAYHDIDMIAAQNDINQYAVKEFKKEYTPEIALQKINEFVTSKGGFNDYDIMFEALNNAIHGLD